MEEERGSPGRSHSEHYGASIQYGGQILAVRNNLRLDGKGLSYRHGLAEYCSIDGGRCHGRNIRGKIVAAKTKVQF